MVVVSVNCSSSIHLSMWGWLDARIVSDPLVFFYRGAVGYMNRSDRIIGVSIVDQERRLATTYSL